uniref:Tectonic family member 2 n=1 Tax=Electrophorus electricus TaxID=8005 RepID=A0A4W4F2V1_ELEEL
MQLVRDWINLPDTCLWFSLRARPLNLGPLWEISVFQPSSLVVSGPSASAFLVGNVSDISLTISNVSPSNTTGMTSRLCRTHFFLTVLIRGLPPPSCLCGNETECCARPLCVRETLRVSACQGNTLLTSLTVQAEIYALLPSAGHVSGNKTVIPNQVFQPLGRCPCDLLPGECDIRCCCDQDCTPELLSLFAGQCLPGPFGGHVTPAPDYSCSAQSAENAPDWFPFLCVTSPSENNPLLGLFYQGKTLLCPACVPRLRVQMAVLGRCLEKAPVAFLQDFEAACVSVLQECPGPAAELGVAVRDGLGGGFLWEANRCSLSLALHTFPKSTYVFCSFRCGHLYTLLYLYLVGNGQCSTADLRPVLYGLNSTSGCLVSVSLLNLTQCSHINHDIHSRRPANLYFVVFCTVCRFRINFTEFDCERNDVCWPELVFPLTTYYKGEPHSQALAKGLILVFFFIAASVLGTPWRQIRQAWGSIQL